MDTQLWEKQTSGYSVLYGITQKQTIGDFQWGGGIPY